MIRAALFDLDGTLVSSLPELAKGVEMLSRELGAPVPPEAVVGDMIGGGVRVLIDRLFLWWQGAGAKELPDFESTLQRLVAIWSGMSGDLIREIPGAFAGVQSLKEAGISVWLVTNKERGLTEAFLRERGIDALFNGLVAAGDCAHPKPAPDMLIKAITSAGAEASEAVMVGDSRNDALAARAAGIRAMLVESGYNEGVPLKEWARTAGFNEVFPSVKEVCEELLAQQGSRKCGDCHTHTYCRQSFFPLSRPELMQQRNQSRRQQRMLRPVGRKRMEILRRRTAASSSILRMPRVSTRPLLSRSLRLQKRGTSRLEGVLVGISSSYLVRALIHS